jgi:Ca-activated chloride channel family protein
MKPIIICLIFILVNTSAVFAQTAVDFFNRAANQYIYQNENVALNTIDSGLKTYPDDQGLLNLRDKILKDKQKQDQQKQDQQEQQNQDQQKKEQQEQEQNKEQEQNQEQQQESEDNKDAEKKEQQQQAKPEETQEKGEEMDQPPMSRSERLEELNLTEEKARMILEAMKNNEIQYIQQNRRKPTKRPDSNKPDW